MADDPWRELREQSIADMRAGWEQDRAHQLAMRKLDIDAARERAQMAEQGALERSQMQYGLGGSSDRALASRLAEQGLQKGWVERGQDVTAALEREKLGAQQPGWEAAAELHRSQAGLAGEQAGLARAHAEQVGPSIEAQDLAARTSLFKTAMDNQYPLTIEDLGIDRFMSQQYKAAQALKQRGYVLKDGEWLPPKKKE